MKLPYHIIEILPLLGRKRTFEVSDYNFYRASKYKIFGKYAGDIRSYLTSVLERIVSQLNHLDDYKINLVSTTMKCHYKVNLYYC